jgi:hypothetical protein
MNGDSSHAVLRVTIATDRRRIAAGERPLYHAMWTPSVDGSADVRIRELPIIHLLVPDRAGVIDGARCLVARYLAVPPGAFDVVPDEDREQQRG